MTLQIQAARSRLFMLSVLLMFLGGVNCVRAQWNTSGNNISNANSGNVGIGTGTDTPGQKLTVNGIIQTYPAGNGGGHIQFDNTSNYWRILQTAQGTSGKLVFTQDNVADVLTLQGNGNVGIGTMSPSTLLHLYNSNNGTTGLRLENPNSGSSSEARLRVVADSALVDMLAQSVAGGQLVQFQAQNNLGMILNQVSNSYLALQTNNAERMRISSGGNVGIGTTNPGVALDIGGIPIAANNSKTFRIAALSGGSYFGAGIDGGLDSAGSGFTRLHTYHAGNDYTILYGNSSGNVGIGTTSPGSYRLNVNGDTNVSGNLNIVANGASPGNIVAAGTINAKYQDVAEWVPASEQLSAGTVVVLDSTKSNQVTSSSTSYDTRVAGVVSERPGLALGEKSEGKVLVATTGRVRVKVDASKGPINIGDLLVTSDVSGLAMKSEPIMIGGRQIHAPGTIVGKALEPLAKGKGEILVLLSLQ